MALVVCRFESFLFDRNLAHGRLRSRLEEIVRRAIACKHSFGSREPLGPVADTAGDQPGISNLAARYPQDNRYRRRWTFVRLEAGIGTAGIWRQHRDIDAGEQLVVLAGGFQQADEEVTSRPQFSTACLTSG